MRRTWYDLVWIVVALCAGFYLGVAVGWDAGLR